MPSLDKAATKVCDALPDGVVIAGSDRRILVANHTAERMLGQQGLVGKELGAGLQLQDEHGADWCSTNRPYDGLGITTGIPEQAWICPDGTEVLVTARLSRAVTGGEVQLVALTLRSARGRARLDRERSDLVATVAHELRSPLTGVRGFVRTLLSKWDRFNDEQKKLMLATVDADSARLARLITELLDVARIDTGRLALYPRPVQLSPVVDGVLESARTGTTRKLEHDPGADLPPILADPDKLVQVVTNLVDNALRHGEGLVQVTTETLGDRVRLVVDDEGEGIPEAIRLRVFTKFWKDGIRGGTGLGMYLVNGLVHAHGGELAISDSPSGGARITVDWPTGSQSLPDGS